MPDTKIKDYFWIPLISGKYGLRNHCWPLECCFLMRKSEKNAFFSKPSHGPILISWNLILYTFLWTKIKKITIGNIFSLDACLSPMCLSILDFQKQLRSQIFCDKLYAWKPKLRSMASTKALSSWVQLLISINEPFKPPHSHNLLLMAICKAETGKENMTLPLFSLKT